MSILGLKAIVKIPKALHFIKYLSITNYEYEAEFKEFKPHLGMVQACS